MRLVSYEGPKGPALGVAARDGGTIFDLSWRFGAADVGAMLATGVSIGEIEDPRASGRTYEPDEVRLLAPIARPGKIICVGLNYHDHCREQSIEPPAYPMLFSKFANAVTDPGAPVTRPAATEKLDLECELAVVIGSQASGVSVADAPSVIFGYTILNDVTMRDLQKEDRQWLRAKGSDGFAPIGPVIVTADEIADPGSLGVRSSVNGETWQDSSTAEMVFDVPTIVAFASRTITLEPGDVIATGTPAGVGHYQTPPRYLSDGDLMRCEIEGIGTLENPVVDARPRIQDHERAAGVVELLARR